MSGRAPKPMKPHDLAVIARTADGALLVRDPLTGDLRQVAAVGRPLTALEAHLCGMPEDGSPC